MGLGLQGLELRVLAFGFRVLNLELRVLGLQGFKALAFRA